jgi:hypothetical protein
MVLVVSCQESMLPNIRNTEECLFIFSIRTALRLRSRRAGTFPIVHL